MLRAMDENGCQQGQTKPFVRRHARQRGKRCKRISQKRREINNEHPLHQVTSPLKAFARSEQAARRARPAPRSRGSSWHRTRGDSVIRHLGPGSRHGPSATSNAASASSGKRPAVPQTKTGPARPNASRTRAHTVDATRQRAIERQPAVPQTRRGIAEAGIARNGRSPFVASSGAASASPKINMHPTPPLQRRSQNRGRPGKIQRFKLARRAVIAPPACPQARRRASGLSHRHPAQAIAEARPRRAPDDRRRVLDKGSPTTEKRRHAR